MTKRRWGLCLILASGSIAGCSPALSPMTPRMLVNPPTTPSLCAAVAHEKPCFSSQPAPTTTPTLAVTTLGSVAFSDPLHGWAVGSDCKDTCAVEVAATVDGGAVWGAPQHVGSVSPQLEQSVAAVGVRFAGRNGWIFGPGIFETHDSGRSWKQTMTTTVIALEPDGNSVWAVEDCSPRPCQSTLIVSQSVADTWQAASSQPPLAETGGDPQTPGIVLERAPHGVAFLAAPTADRQQGLYASHDIGKSWRTLSAPCDDIVSVRSIDAVHVWVLCSTPCCTGNYIKALFASGNGGISWKEEAATDPNFTGTIPFYGQALALVVTSPSVGLFGASGEAGIWRSTDTGSTWRPVFSDACVEGGNDISEIWFVDPLHGWANAGLSVDSECPSLLRTVDGGQTWTPLRAPFGA